MNSLKGYQEHVCVFSTVLWRWFSVAQESIQLSVSRHSDELKEIFDAIPMSDMELLNRSRQVLTAS